MEFGIQKLDGANMDIDLASPEGSIAWQQATCPWNQAESVNLHKCAVKNISICPYFCGVEYLDRVLCCYPIVASDNMEAILAAGRNQT